MRFEGGPVYCSSTQAETPAKFGQNGLCICKPTDKSYKPRDFFFHFNEKWLSDEFIVKVWGKFSPSVHAQCCTIDDLSNFFSNHTLLFRTNESCIV